MKVDLRDEFVSRALFADGVWEPETQRLAAHAIRPGSVVIDVGANIGAHTLQFARLTGSTGRVFAFEPEAYNFSLLEQNVQLNKLENVELYRVALGATTGVAKLQLAQSNWGDHRVNASDGTVEIPLKTLDEALPDSTRGNVSFVKIDVQGYEAHVLRGMANTIAANEDAIVLTEIFPLYLQDAGSSADEMLSLIQDLGLTGWEFKDYRISPISPAWMYELLLGRKEESLVLSRNGHRLAQVMSAYFGKLVPPPGI